MLGTIGIPLTKGNELLAMMEMSINGTYKNQYSGKETKLSEKAQEEMSTQTAFYFLYLLGLAPSEVGSYVNYNVKALKKLKKPKESKPVPFNKPKPKKKPKKKITKKPKTTSPLMGGSSKNSGGLMGGSSKNSGGLMD